MAASLKSQVPGREQEFGSLESMRERVEPSSLNRRRIIEIKDLSEKISAEINALAVTKEGDAEDEDD